MASSLYQQMNQQSQPQPQSGNPLFQNNPQVQQILNEVRTSGKSAKDLFFERAQQMGIDPQSVIARLQQMM